MDNLDPSGIYRMIIFAVNAKGRSEPILLDNINFKGVAKYIGESLSIYAMVCMYALVNNRKRGMILLAFERQRVSQKYWIIDSVPCLYRFICFGYGYVVEDDRRLRISVSFRQIPEINSIKVLCKHDLKRCHVKFVI